MSNRATETKTKASSATAAATGLLLWVLQTYVFKGAVPPVLESWIYVLVPGILSWAAGYFAPHTHRPDLDPPAVVPAGLPQIPSATTTGYPQVTPRVEEAPPAP